MHFLSAFRFGSWPQIMLPSGHVSVAIILIIFIIKVGDTLSHQQRGIK
jgi:hypothetical protein